MRSIEIKPAILIALPIILISCYSKRQVLAYYPNGKVRVERHRKLFDSLNEIYVTYYDNGKVAEKDYWRNRHAVWAEGNIKMWYSSGAKKFMSITKYKDTIGFYNATDSSYIFKGLSFNTTKSWFENGKLHFESYPENGKMIYVYNNEKGDSLVKQVVRNVRPDGYDTIKTGKIYIKR
jgi:antitoxin component YwqK of YwqJK toxin-antitoxin module